MAGQFDMKTDFPIAGVADLLAQRPYKEALMKQAQQEQLINGLKTFGSGVQSLVDRRNAMAQALSAGQYLGVDPNQAQSMMTPENVVSAYKAKSEGLDTPTLLQGLAAITGNPAPFGIPPQGQTPGAVGNPSSGQPALPSAIPAMTGKNTSAFLLKAAEAVKQQKQFTQAHDIQQQQFDETKATQLASKKEQIEKEFAEKNLAINNAVNAVGQSLDLKRGATSGPISGTAAALAANVSGGALAPNTYQLIQHNMRSSPLLQHAQEVNRFNPQEVQYLNVANLSQPKEPLNISETKAYNAVNSLAERINSNEEEKAMKLKALGINYQPQKVTPEQLLPNLKAQKVAGLTPQEQEEFNRLHKKFGGQ